MPTPSTRRSYVQMVALFVRAGWSAESYADRYTQVRPCNATTCTHARLVRVYFHSLMGCANVHLAAALHEELHPYVPNNMLFDACQLQMVESESEPCPEAEGYVDAESDGSGTTHRNRQDRGVWACTHFRLATVSNCQRYAAYEVRLSTGRTHQIRVHFAGANFPLANDFF